MKQCNNCKEIKELTDFYKKKSSKDGLAHCCKTCSNLQVNAWTKANRERSNKIKNAYRHANQEKVIAQIKRWEKANPGKRAAQVRKYQASKLNATPKWLTRDQLMEIQSFYADAAIKTKETGIPHEVDHMVPLQGKNVRGLHVPWNLQVMARSPNRRKSNK